MISRQKRLRPRKKTTKYLRFIRSLFVFSIFIGCISCVHTVSKKEKATATGHYKMGLALVHEAQKYGLKLENSAQDLKWRQALEELLNGVKLDPESADLQYMLGLTYFLGFRRFDEAKLHLLKALEIKADNYPEADLLLGTLLVEENNAEESLIYLERARNNLLYKTPYYAEQEIGWAYFKLADYDRAARHLEVAIAAQPNLCGSYLRLVEVHESRKDYEQATQVAHDFIEQCDQDLIRDACGPDLLSHGYYRYGIDQLVLKNMKAAKEAFEICVERFPKQKIYKECRKSLRLFSQ